MSFKKFVNDSLVWVVRGIKGFNFEVRLASEEVKTLMKLNAVNVDVAALKALKNQRPDGITEEDIPTILYVGKTLRTLLPPAEIDPDAPEGGVPCSTCGEFFTPIMYKNKDGERRGSITELKAEKFEQTVKDSKDESLSSEDRKAAVRFLKSSEELGTILMKGRVLHNIRFFATCPHDVHEERKPKAVIVDGRLLRDEKGKVVKEGIYFTYFTISDVLAQATVHDARIAGGKADTYVRSLKKGLANANFRRPGAGENRGDNRRGGFRGQRRPDDRPRKDFLGGDFLVPSADALIATQAAGKLAGGLAQLAEASDEFLRNNGIADSAAGFNAVRTIARKTLERQAANEAVPASDNQPASGATLADAPSAKNLAGLQFPSQKKVARRGKSKGPRTSKADRIVN